jgi:hypothetical protein
MMVTMAAAEKSYYEKNFTQRLVNGINSWLGQWARAKQEEEEVGWIWFLENFHRRARYKFNGNTPSDTHTHIFLGFAGRSGWEVKIDMKFLFDDYVVTLM